MQRFKSPEQAQHSLSSHAMIYGHFRPRRHLMAAVEYRIPAPKPSDLAAGDVRPNRSVNIGVACRVIKRAHQSDNLTMPLARRSRRAAGAPLAAAGQLGEEGGNGIL